MADEELRPAAEAQPDEKAPSGWGGIWSFLDGLGGAGDRLEGIADSAGNIAQTYADADRAMWEVRNDQRDADFQRDMQELKTMRGDNRVMIYAAGAAAVALIFLMR